MAIPGGLLEAIIDAVKPESRGKRLEKEMEAAATVLERFGWEMQYTDNPKWITKRYAPLRMLAALWERHSAHPLTGHVLEALRLALRWCENTSPERISPISGKADGKAPEGVLYPRISIELQPLETWRDIPKEWSGTAVKGAPHD